MIEVKAIDDAMDGESGSPSLFLAGGITGCPDWQRDVVTTLAVAPLTVFNPRRDTFDVLDTTASEKQIEWEFRHIHAADAVSFWFPGETLCPIVLFELGAHLGRRGTPLFIGVHPEYRRRSDVEIQTRLARPGQSIVHSLADLADQILHWAAPR